jgi:hypothetical protein
MKRISAALAIFVISLIYAAPALCADSGIKTGAAKPEEAQGSYTLILYGSRHSSDIETVAILDKEGDEYTFEPYAPEFDYRIKKGVPAKEALEHAQGFINWHSAFHYSQLSKIIDPKKNVIGYELRPLYRPLEFGVSDVLDIRYRLKNNKVIVYIKLIPSVERRLFDFDTQKEDK